jgi:hypothetical protein
MRDRPWMQAYERRRERRRLILDTFGFLWLLFLVVVVLPIVLAPAPV